MSTDACRICGSTSTHQEYELQERMFGTGDRFRYFQCAECRCLQIGSPPTNPSRYYPAHYHSLIADAVPQFGLKSRLAGLRDRAWATGKPWWAGRLSKPKTCLPHLASLRRVSLSRNSRILDVGCGRGQFLSILHRAGFGCLTGVDPFLAADHEVISRLWVRRLPLDKLAGSFDLIMLHHVLEHVERQLDMLRECKDRLAPGGRILIRLPIVDCEVWDLYQEFGVQLDAPRHFFLHSRASFELLVRQAGLKLESRWCDSNGFQFWGSELYRRGLPLNDKNGEQVDPSVHFSKRQLAGFEHEAERLNAIDRGDQLVAILSQTSEVKA